MYSKILVPVDGSEASYAGLREAAAIAKQLGSKLRLLHVVDELVLVSAYSAALTGETIDVLRADGRMILDQAQGFVRRQGLQPECVLLEKVGGRAADVILAQAREWGADLIVIGTHGRHGILRMALGSDAEQVVRSADVPVLLVRAQSGAAHGLAQEAVAVQAD